MNAGDAELLVEWHADPEVSRYWDDHVYTLQEMRERLARPDVDRYVIKAEGVLVGFIRAWREGGGVGLDMFLVPGARGRGLGLDATRSLVAHLVAEGWSRITVDPIRGTSPRYGRGSGRGSSRWRNGLPMRSI